MPKSDDKKLMNFVVERKDADLIEAYAAQRGGFSTYVRSLIERDMRKNGQDIKLTDVKPGGARQKKKTEPQPEL